MHTQEKKNKKICGASINSTTLTCSLFASHELIFFHSFFFRLTVLSCRLICGSMHRTLSCSLARGTTEMEYMTHTHTSIHSFFFPYVPFRGAGLFDSAKLCFHITEVRYSYSRQPQTCYIKTDGEKKKTEVDLGQFLFRCIYL